DRYRGHYEENERAPDRHWRVTGHSQVQRSNILARLMRLANLGLSAEIPVRLAELLQTLLAREVAHVVPGFPVYRALAVRIHDQLHPRRDAAHPAGRCGGPLPRSPDSGPTRR